MAEFGSGYNLPPGVYEHHLPGNRPEDMEAERYAEQIGDEEMVEFAQSELLGDVIYDDEGEWFVEEDEGEKAGPFTNEDEAVSYALVAREGSIMDTMIANHLEAEPDEPDYDSRPGGHDWID